jgi:hypothetical protein
MPLALNLSMAGLGIPGVTESRLHYKILAIADAATGPMAEPGVKLREPKGEADAYGTVAINETEYKGTIFNAATVEWAHGLYRDDSVVSKITRNVLNRLAT